MKKSWCESIPVFAASATLTTSGIPHSVMIRSARLKI